MNSFLLKVSCKYIILELNCCYLTEKTINFVKMLICYPLLIVLFSLLARVISVN